MGMFDEIRCEVALPDGYDTEGVGFQSKSFPDCGLCRYTITAVGRLLDAAGNDLEPEGYLIFYTSDDSEIGEDRWHEYRARFVAGQLQDIVRVAKDEHSRHYYGLASFRWFNTPSFMFGDPFAGDEPPNDPEAGEG